MVEKWQCNKCGLEFDAEPFGGPAVYHKCDVIYDPVKEKEEIGALDGALCYLIGAIDEAPDDGLTYRQYIRAECKNRNVKIKFLDPTHKPNGFQSEIAEEKKKHKSLRENKKWDELSKFMKDIVHLDLRSIDLADFVIAKISKNVPMFGSIHEIVQADIQKKPVILIVEGGKQNTPAWCFGILDHNLFFDSEDQCIEYLEKVNSGSIRLSDKWILIRKFIVTL